MTPWRRYPGESPSAPQGFSQGQLAASEFILTDKSQAGIEVILLSGNAKTDSIGSRLVLQGNPGYLDMLHCCVPDSPRVPAVQDQSGRLVFLAQDYLRVILPEIFHGEAKAKIAGCHILRNHILPTE
jgi:hypothetical protein